MTQQTQPVHEIKLGRLRTSIWANESGRGGIWFSVSINRVYRDGNEWKTTTSFGRDDLPIAAKLLDMAYAWIWNNKGTEDAGS